MKLHWSSRSPYVRKVMICAHEVGVADKLERVQSVVSLSRASEVVMRDNPAGRIPTLVLDDGRALYDSVVICEYLASLKPALALFPDAGEARWTALRRHALGDGMLDALVLWRSEQLKPAQQQSPEWAAVSELKIRKSLDAIEAEADALAASGFDIGHICIGAALTYIDFRFGQLAWRDGHPRTEAWMRQFLARDSVVKSAFVDT